MRRGGQENTRKLLEDMVLFTSDKVSFRVCLQQVSKVTAFGMDTQSGPSSAPTEMGGCLIMLVAYLMACMERNAFQEYWYLISRNVCVNVTCQPLYLSTMQPAEGYQCAQSSKFKVP
jgi:hypothetical protein